MQPTEYADLYDVLAGVAEEVDRWSSLLDRLDDEAVG
jgi:hypothetical protein